jgi:putative membrane protein
MSSQKKKTMQPSQTKVDPRVWLALTLLVLAWSGYQPKDTFTWFLEVAPVLIALPLLLFTRRSFPLTPLVYALLTLHGVILMIGGHYTYAEMPLFNGLRDSFDLARNHYDRVGHVAQGFIPAIVAREILLRTSPLRPGKWLFFLTTCVCLGISAFYEMIEWWVAVGSGDEAVAFLATQGDVWDTQWDMFLALCGALSSLLLLGRWHDRQLAELNQGMK